MGALIQTWEEDWLVESERTERRELLAVYLILWQATSVRWQVCLLELGAGINQGLFGWIERKDMRNEQEVGARVKGRLIYIITFLFPDYTYLTQQDNCLINVLVSHVLNFLNSTSILISTIAFSRFTFAWLTLWKHELISMYHSLDSKLLIK